MKKKHQNEIDGAGKAIAPPVPPVSTARDIFVFGRLENEVALPTIKKLLKLNAADPKAPINLYINSSGGNGYNADGIIAVMHSIEAKVNTICLGHALSGACEILAAGTGTRSAYEFATLMFHQTLWEADGDITNLEIQAVQGRRFREAQIEVLHRASGQSKEVLRKDIERDHYLTAREALDYGFLDTIIEFTGTRHLKNETEQKKMAEPTKAPARAAANSTKKSGNSKKTK